MAKLDYKMLDTLLCQAIDQVMMIMDEVEESNYSDEGPLKDEEILPTFNKNARRLAVLAAQRGALQDKQGQYAKAAEYYHQAARVFENVQDRDQDDRQLIAYLHDWALASLQADDWDGAEQPMRYALGIYWELLGPEHEETVCAISYLAIVLYEQGNHEEAKQLFQDVEAIHQQVLGYYHPKTVSDRNFLGTLDPTRYGIVSILCDGVCPWVRSIWLRLRN